MNYVNSKIWQTQPSGIRQYLLRLLFARHAILYAINGKATILDVGCGKGDNIKWYRKMGVKSDIIGVDIHLPYLHECLSKKVYDGLIRASATHLPFREKTFGSTLFLQAIEHLSKDYGWQALKECERVGTQVIITTPVGFVSQKAYDENDYQIHLSGWTPKSMKKNGFKVRGFNGLSICWVENGDSVLRGPIGLSCILLLALITQPLVFIVPNFGFQMLCIKGR